jgi:hypothetical protein
MYQMPVFDIPNPNGCVQRAANNQIAGTVELKISENKIGVSSKLTSNE